MRFSIASGTKTVKQEGAELDARLNDRYSTRPSDTEMVKMILKNGTAADKGELARLIDFQNGQAVISGKSLEEITST
jgi:hypothetical protein